MASASVTFPVLGPCSISTASNSCERRLSDFESRRLTSKLCASSGVGSLRTLSEREPKPWRLAAQSSRPRRTVRAVTRSQAISSDSFVKTTEKVDETNEVHELIIIGAGVSGLATAAAMEKIGVKSLVLEQSSAPRTTGAALSLWSNAWRVLDVLGVGEELRSMHTPVTGLRMFDQQGDLLRSFELNECPGGPHLCCGVERRLLTDALASLLPQGAIRFNARVVSIKRETQVSPFELTLSDGSVIKTKVLLGADGVNSVVGKWMGVERTRFVGHMGIRGLAVYPDGHPYGDLVRQYCGMGARAGVVPISRSKVYWFLVYSKSTPGPKVTDPNEVKKELLGMLEGWPEFMGELLELTPLENLSRASLADRWALPGTTPVVQNGVTLLGDALHPMTPNIGQGGCCALEDSLVLARTLGTVLAQQGSNADYGSITKAMEEYAAERRQRTFPLTVKSFFMGAILTASFPPLVYLRDKFLLPKMVGPGSFLSHTLYNAGQLPVIQTVLK